MNPLDDLPGAPPEAAPIPNRRTDAQPEFDTKTDVYLNWQEAFRGWLEIFRGKLAELPDWSAGFTEGVQQSAGVAQAAAAAAQQSAQAAQSVLGARVWAPGDSYQVGDVVFGITRPGVPYRCHAAVSGVDVFPENDPDHWAVIGYDYAPMPLYAGDPARVNRDMLSGAGYWHHAEPGKVYSFDTRAGGFGVYLPQGARYGDWVGIHDEFLSFRRASIEIKAQPDQCVEGILNTDGYLAHEGLILDRPFRGVAVYLPGPRGWTLI